MFSFVSGSGRWLPLFLGLLVLSVCRVGCAGKASAQHSWIAADVGHAQHAR